jgi:hypothetical protein
MSRHGLSARGAYLSGPRAELSNSSCDDGFNMLRRARLLSGGLGAELEWGGEKPFIRRQSRFRYRDQG